MGESTNTMNYSKSHNSDVLVSVVMSCYQEPNEYIKKAIDSILSQTLTSFEFIIVLDNPESDRIADLLSKYKKEDERIKVIKHDKNFGLAVARNTAISAAQGKYIALMDADDIALPNRLEIQHRQMEEGKCDLLFSHMEYIDEAGDEIGSFIPKEIEKISKRSLLRTNILAHPTGFIKTNVFSKECYDSNLNKSQDMDLWLRLLDYDLDFCVIDKKLLKRRLYRNSSLERRLKRQRDRAKYEVKVFLKHLSNLWKIPMFWYWGIVKLSYYSLLYLTPAKILFFAIKVKDYFRN